MKRNIVLFIILIVLTISSLIIFIYEFDKNTLVSTLFANISTGFITGITILVFTNIKNSTIHKYNIKIRVLGDIINKSREYEVKIINYNSQKEVSILEMINIYADISNLFTDIYNYNKDFYTQNNINYNELIDSCSNIVGDLSNIMYKINITHNEFITYKKDLDNKYLKMFHLRRNIEKELKIIQNDNEKLCNSIL